MEQFRKLGIDDAILRAIKDERFESPTEIQKKAIPLVIKGRDVLAGSATGSGKTLAFGSGIIQYCSQGNGIQALILTPTRELAEQVSESIKKFSKYRPLKIASVYGGVSIGPQFERLKTADIVVGTPGRVLDHISRGTIKLGRIKTLVLDEADRMLDMGFIRDVEKIINVCPKDRQTLLFSATLTGEILHLSRKYMRNPAEVSVESYVDSSKLKQIYYNVDDRMKFSLLVHLLKTENAWLSMVFCNTQRNTDFVASNLKFSGIRALAIHGGLTQDKRNRIMKEFNSEKGANVLVCTDVAARGLDIKGVSHVYNYDSPKESKTYIHRIGRTARAGEKGLAITILTTRDYENFRRVLTDRSLEVEMEEVPRIERAIIRVKDSPGKFRPGAGRMPQRHQRQRIYSRR